MISSTRTQHLSDADFSDLLAGEIADNATRVHLADCEYCRTELHSVRNSLVDFSDLSTRWSHTFAPVRVPVPSRWVLRLGSVPSWTTGLAMTALTGVLVFNFGPVGHGRSHMPTSPAVTVAPSNTELADDNRLMLSIDQELGYRQQPATGSGLRAGTHHAGHHSAETVLD